MFSISNLQLAKNTFAWCMIQGVSLYTGGVRLKSFTGLPAALHLIQMVVTVRFNKLEPLRPPVERSVLIIICCHWLLISICSRTTRGRMCTGISSRFHCELDETEPNIHMNAALITGHPHWQEPPNVCKDTWLKIARWPHGAWNVI